MKANELVRLHGDALVGRRILTEPIGMWAGGECEVVELLPDKGAPDIVFQVRRDDGAEIGVLDWETVELCGRDE